MKRLILCTLLLAAGCAVGPDYQRPAAISTPAFKELAGWKPATPADHVDRGAWWMIYHDPELDRLEAQVAISNQNVRAAVAAYDQALAVVGEAQSALFPTLSTAPGITRGQSGTVSSNGRVFSRTRTTNTAELTASWTVDVWGKLRRTVEADNALAQASAADLANATLAAQALLAQDYFALRAAEALKAILDTTVADDRRALQIATNQYNAGAAARSDLIAAQTQLQGAIATAINAGVQRAQLEHAIAVLTGHPPGDVTITPGPFTQEVPVVPVGIPSELLERRPDIAAAEQLMASQNAQIGVAIAAYYPQVSLSAIYGFSGNPLSSLFEAANRVWSLGASANELLLDGGARSATVRAARAAYDQAVANYRQTVLTAFQGVEDQLSTLRILQDQYAAQLEAVRLARQAVEVTLNQYRAGTISYTAVITAQNTLLADQQTLISVQQQRLVASVTLVQDLGGGWALQP
jgi:NodT family efflux transporter outer membrane factor (OMF) lipoprotein